MAKQRLPDIADVLYKITVFVAKRLRIGLIDFNENFILKILLIAWVV